MAVLIKEAQNTFNIYEGIRLDKKTKVPISDDPFKASPSAFAFSPDNSMLVIGTKEGSVYGFTITGERLDIPHKYKYNLGNETN